MAKEFQEPEEMEMDNTELVDDFNPLDEAVNEKDYTKHNVKLNAKDFTSPIPEPTFTPPPMSGGLTNEEKDKKPAEPFNPKMKEMSTKDKNMASSRVAEMLMTAYKWGNKVADKSLQFDEKKINKMQMNGELDLNVQIPISATDTISAGEFIQEFNDQSKDTIVVTQEFEDEVMPVLTSVLSKRGVGMTEEQELAYLIGKDVAVKGFMMYQSLSVKKDTLKMIKELSLMQGATFTQPQPTPQPTYTPPPTPQPTYQEEVYVKPHNPETNVNDFVNEMTGGIPPTYEYTPQTEVPIPSDVEFQTDDLADDVYQEPKPSVKIISEGNSKKIKTNRGRPKKK